MSADDWAEALQGGAAHGARLMRMLALLRRQFDCGAVCLLQIEGDTLRPLASDGLSAETMGRRFEVAHHPRLAAILERRHPVRFAPGSPLPDPYDGLLSAQPGQALPVHDCMGITLSVEARPWGVLTLDALSGEPFGEAAQQSLGRAARWVELGLRLGELEDENRRLRTARTPVAPVALMAEAGRIIGQSPALLELMDELAIVAPSGLPVLLLGETGVGKELFARHLHGLSARAQRPFVQVNCAALPEALAESELFGHIKGAFSGAQSARAGRIEAADGGTLFLDEVGELPLPVQAKLLRTLQNGEIQRLGADTPHRVDVRIVAATNRALQARVREGLFRADLYHRLSVYPLPIPPLRERGDDVLLIAGYFLEINRTRLGVRSLRLSPQAGRALCAYGWPGNVRELEHVISRAALRALGLGGARDRIVTLEPEHLDLDVRGAVPSVPAPQAGAQAAAGAVVPLKAALEAYQRELLAQALDAAGGNWAQAARLLELDASNLHKLARRLGIKA